MQSAADISADLTALYAARTALATGQRIEMVWREGRRLTYGPVTLDSLNALIQQREGELAQAQASEAGKPKRQAIRAYF